MLTSERWQTFETSWKKTQYLINTLYIKSIPIGPIARLGQTNQPTDRLTDQQRMDMRVHREVRLPITWIKYLRCGIYLQ